MNCPICNHANPPTPFAVECGYCGFVLAGVVSFDSISSFGPGTLFCTDCGHGPCKTPDECEGLGCIRGRELAA